MCHDFTQHEPFNFVIIVEGLRKNIKTLNVHKTKQTNKQKPSFVQNAILLIRRSSYSIQHI